MHSITMKKFKSAALAVAAGALAVAGAGQSADAALIVNFRFPDGSTSQQVDVTDIGSTFTVDVWATVTGTGAGAEGYQAMYFGAQTQELATSIDGDITGRELVAPFAASGNSLGTLQELSYAPGGSDGQVDLGGTSLSSATGFARPYAGPGTFVTAGGQAVANGVEFRVATLTYTADLILPALGDAPALAIYPILPTSLLAATRATWQQDGVNVNAGTAGTGGYAAGTGVQLVAVPEPASAALLAVGAGAAALLRRRRK